MERPVIAERIARVIAVECDIREQDIEPSKRLVDDFGLDSLDLAELQVALEDEFEVDLPASYNDACTVRDIIDLLDHCVNARKQDIVDIPVEATPNFDDPNDGYAFMARLQKDQPSQPTNDPPRKHWKYRVNGWVAGKDADSWLCCPFMCQEFGTCNVDKPEYRECEMPIHSPAPEWCPIRNGGIWIEGVECAPKEEE